MNSSPNPPRRDWPRRRAGRRSPRALLLPESELPPGHAQNWLLLCRAQARAQTPMLQTIGTDEFRAPQPTVETRSLMRANRSSSSSERAPLRSSNPLVGAAVAQTLVSQPKGEHDEFEQPQPRPIRFMRKRSRRPSPPTGTESWRRCGGASVPAPQCCCRRGAPSKRARESIGV